MGLTKNKWFVCTYWLKHRPETQQVPIEELVYAVDEKKAAGKIIGHHSHERKTATVTGVRRHYPDVTVRERNRRSGRRGNPGRRHRVHE